MNSPCCCCLNELWGQNLTGQLLGVSWFCLISSLISRITQVTSIRWWLYMNCTNTSISTMTRWVCVSSRSEYTFFLLPPKQKNLQKLTIKIRQSIPTLCIISSACITHVMSLLYSYQRAREEISKNNLPITWRLLGFHVRFFIFTPISKYSTLKKCS